MMEKKLKKDLKRGDLVHLKRPFNIWIERTADEIKLLREQDARNGRWHDDAGEPILYGAYGGWTLVPPSDELDLVVTSLRPKNWLGWGRRPKGLTSGFSYELGREVLFVR